MNALGADRWRSSPGAGRRRWVLSAAASQIMDHVDSFGGDPDEVLAHSGIEPGKLDDDRSQIDLAAFVDLIEIAAVNTGNDNFGLDYGQKFTPERLGLIGQIALASPSLRAALVNLTELFPYHQHATVTQLVEGVNYARLEYRILDGDIFDRRQDAELTLGMFVNIIRRCAGPRWAPLEVFCEHPRPRNWRAHEAAFDAPVMFGQRTNALIFPAEELDRPMPGANLRHLAALREELVAIGAESRPIDVIDRVKSEVRIALPNGACTIAQIADALGLARWTLQRRLDQKGASFSELISRVRWELAHRYLRQRALSVTEIAFMLGYSELSAFSRAFSRSHGMSPQEFRGLHIPAI